MLFYRHSKAKKISRLTETWMTHEILVQSLDSWLVIPEQTNESQLEVIDYCLETHYDNVELSPKLMNSS